MLAEEPSQLEAEPRELLPFRGRDQQVRRAQLREPADMVLVEVGEDRRTDVARRVPERGEPR